MTFDANGAKKLGDSAVETTASHGLYTLARKILEESKFDRDTATNRLYQHIRQDDQLIDIAVREAARDMILDAERKQRINLGACSLGENKAASALQSSKRIADSIFDSFALISGEKLGNATLQDLETDIGERKHQISGLERTRQFLMAVKNNKRLKLGGRVRDCWKEDELTALWRKFS